MGLGGVMKRRTLAALSLACVLASSAAAFAVPLPDRGPSSLVGPELALLPSGEATRAATPAQFSAGQTLLLDARLGHEVLGQRGSGETYLFAQVTGADKATDRAAAPPVNLGIVIDKSGSMKGERIANALSAAVLAVERMRDGDKVTVVSFAVASEVVVPPTVIGPDTRAGIEARIRGIRLGGDTCISCGLESAMHELMRTPAGADQVSRMLLLSDGATNAGIRDVPGLRSLAGRMRDRGCSISTIGVDVDFDEKVMAAIANEASGRHYFVRDAAGLPAIFAQEFDSLVASVARDSELVVTLAPGVEVEQVFDRAFRRQGDRLIIPFGSVSRAQQKTVLIKLRVPVGAAGPQPVADMKLAFRDLIERADGASVGALALEVRAGASDPSLDPFVAARLERSRTAQSLTHANLLFEAGNVAGARAALADRRTELKEAAKLALSEPFAQAPRASRPLSRDFDEQLGAVANAEAFGGAKPTAGAPARPAPAPDSAAGKGAVRGNQATASDLAF
jgi:Ca-activated chloride channel homolog